MSGFIKVQRDCLIVCRNFITLKSEHLSKHFIPITDLAWLSNDTDFVEIFTVLWLGGLSGLKSREKTREHYSLIMQKVFNIPINNWDALLSRAKGRKKDVAPCLTKLHKVFEDYANSNL